MSESPEDQEVRTMLNLMEQRSRGRNTRIKILKATIELGHGFHKGREIAKKYAEMFKLHFDYMYMEPLVFSYKILVANQKVRRKDFVPLAKDLNFKIKDKYFESLKGMISQVNV